MRAPHHHTDKTKQRGAALMVMLVIMVMGGAAFLVSSFSMSALKTARQEATVATLAQAKEALIGYAAGDINRPGELPCPDIDGDGKLTMGTDYSFGSPPLCASFVGYLPWFTLGLPELRDGNNEKLWYALSTNFYAGNNTPLNSDTPGQLSITGNVTMSNAVAIVFAPGPPLTGQSRSSSPVALCTTAGTTIPPNQCAANYLEGDNANSDTAYVANFPSDTFNDSLLVITASNIFQPVEKRIGGEIRQMLNTYYAAWGAYPFAAPFSDPSTSSFIGAAGAFSGLLPRASTATPANLAAFPVWRIPSLTANATGGTVSGIFVTKTGTKLDSSWRYESMVITGTPTITITGILDNVGFGLWPPYDPTTTQISVRVGTTYYSVTDPTYGMTNVSVQGALQPDGSALVTFKGTINPSYIPDRIRFKDIRPCVFQATYCPSTSTTWPAWYSTNNWDHLIYYATSPGFAPGGGNTCIPPSCLTLNGSGSGNNKRAIVVMMSDRLTSQISLPSNDPARYLELENVTPADFIYENKPRSSSFNDQVIVVSP